MDRTKYIAYYRVSTKRQDLGLDAQQIAVTEYAKRSGAEIIAEYSEKESGTKDNRPELDKALRQCRKTGATLLIAKIDRLSRHAAFLWALDDSGVQFEALDLPMCNTMTKAIFFAIAQHEREMISQRTKAALAAKKAAGAKLGNPRNFTEEERAAAARIRKEIADRNGNNARSAMAIRLYLADGGKPTLQAIADHLNATGHSTSRGLDHSAMSVKLLCKRYSIDRA